MAMRTTFSRNGRAWRVDSDGLFDIIGVGPDVLRIDHKMQNGERLGSLVEEQRTNILKYSDQFAGPDFNNQGVQNFGISPDGQNNAVQIDLRNDGDTRIINVLPVGNLNPGDIYTTSAFARADPPGTFATQLRQGSSYTGDIVAGIDWRRFQFGDAVPQTGNYQPYWADNRENNTVEFLQLWGAQIERGASATSYIPTAESARERAADFFDAPGALNAETYGPGLHTWRNAVRMSRDPGEPTILSSAEHRIYASNGRLHLDGPGELIQPDGEHAPGDYVPFIWNVQFPGAAPDFALGRQHGDANWWNGHLVDIVPLPRKLTAAEINAWVGA